MRRATIRDYRGLLLAEPIVARELESCLAELWRDARLLPGCEALPAMVGAWLRAEFCGRADFLHACSAQVREIDEHFRVRRRRPRLLLLGAGSGAAAYVVGYRGAQVTAVECDEQTRLACRLMRGWFSERLGDPPALDWLSGTFLDRLRSLPEAAFDGAVLQTRFRNGPTESELCQQLDRIVKPTGIVLWKESKNRRHIADRPGVASSDAEGAGAGEGRAGRWSPASGIRPPGALPTMGWEVVGVSHQQVVPLAWILGPRSSWMSQLIDRSTRWFPALNTWAHESTTVLRHP